jgi:hypothetical protein
MHTSLVEEAALTDTTETTALVPAEPEVIEGEVVVIESPETSEVYTPPKPYWLLVPFTILFCLVFLAGTFLLPLLAPSATITIIPVEKNVSITAAIQVHGRQLPALTLSQSEIATATGKRHQNATRATGTITLYNGQFSHQTIDAGTILTGNDGVQIITDQAASIPPGNPPVYGQVTVSAHAIVAGASGNIPAYDINTACCATSVLAKNTIAFTGGQRPRDYVVVTKSDIATVTATIQTSIEKSERAALEAQVNPGEGVITPPCSNQIITTHQPGDEARDVTVTLSETCSGIVYIANALHQKAIQMLDQQALQQFGTGYSRITDVTVQVLHASITDSTKGIATIAVKLDAIYVYQLPPAEKQQLIHLVAGRTKQSAVQALLQVPGIQAAAVTINDNSATLPADQGRITIVVVYRSA